MFPLRAPLRSMSLLVSFLFICTTLYSMTRLSKESFSTRFNIAYPFNKHGSNKTHVALAMMATISDYFVNYPMSDGEFGEMGRRTEILIEWMEIAETLKSVLSKREHDEMEAEIENLTFAMFPFLSKNPGELYPLRALRRSYVPKSRGLVIAAGQNDFRFACH